MITISCACGRQYRVPPEAAGKRATCRSCSAVLRIPAALAHEAIPLKQPEPPAARTTLHPAPPPIAHPRRAPALRERTYFGDLLRALAFPAKPGGIGALLTIAILNSLSMIPFALAMLAFSAMVYTYYFSVITSTAGGDDSLPLADFFDEGLAGIVAGFFRFVGTGLILALPGFLTLLAMPLLGQGQEVAVAAALIVGALGLALWPMALLAVSMGGLSAFLRFDLLILSAIRVLPSYLITLLAVGFAGALEFFAAQPLDLGLPPVADLLVQAMLGGLGGAYAGLFAMQAIGLLYHHHSDRFAWSGG